MSSRPARYVILDTNIFRHLNNESLAIRIIEVLRTVVEKNYGIALSQYTLIELVDGATPETEQKRLNVVRGFKQYHIRQNVLLVAGHLGCLYKEDGLDDKQQPERGDKIIGATAIIHNCLIYTTNVKDFPEPYFRVVNKHYLFYRKDARDVVIVGYLIEPDIETITYRYNHRVNNPNTVQVVPMQEKTEL